MKRTLILATLFFGFALFVPAHALADSRYKRSRWASRLAKGVLQVRGPGYGTWGRKWVTVATRVRSYREKGTARGPVIIYSRGARAWSVVQLRYNTGRLMNRRHFNKPITLVRVGRYGVIIRVGKRCYDYSWYRLRGVRCR